MNIYTKICGIRDLFSAQTAADHGAAYIGFVFYEKSIRNISAKSAAEIVKEIPRRTIPVAVMVDPTDQQLQEIFAHFEPGYLQLHGQESPDRVDQIKLKYGIPIIKAFSISTSKDIEKSKNYHNVADMFLFDSKPPKNAPPGGNGLKFNWNLLSKHDFKSPVLISGGINVENVEEAIKTTGIRMIDVSSGVESSPGVKDPNKIIKLLKTVENL